MGVRMEISRSPATRKLAASATNAALRPNTTVNPAPRAAPTASIAPHVADIMAVATGRSSSSTRLATPACDAGPKKAPSAVTPPWATNTIHGRPGPGQQEGEGDRRLGERDDHQDLLAVEAVGHRPGDRGHEERREALGDPEQRRQQVGAGGVEQEADRRDGREPVARVADQLRAEESAELTVSAEEGPHRRRAWAPAGGSGGSGAPDPPLDADAATHRPSDAIRARRETGTGALSGPDWTRTSDLFRVEEAL